MIHSTVRLATLLLLSDTVLNAQAKGAAPDIANPVVLMIILGMLTLAPFLAVMTTSFVKISVVLSMVKTAIGTQVPPSIVTNGLSIILTIFIMAPVASDMYVASEIKNVPSSGVFNTDNLTAVFKVASKGKEPLRKFLLRHAHAEDRALFLSLQPRLERRPGQTAPVVSTQEGALTPAGAPAPDVGRVVAEPKADEEFLIVLPAFVTSELKGAFQIGFLVLLPFVVVDLVVAAVLTAMGLQSIQATMVSMPLKILLFVAADGWYMLVKGLVLGYAQ